MGECPKCRRTNAASARFCASCGAQLSTAAKQTKRSEWDEIDEHLDRVGDEVDAQIEAALDDVSPGTGPSTVAAADSAATAAVQPDGRRLAPGARAVLHEQQWGSLLLPEEVQVRQSASFVLSSPHVQSNPQYSSRVKALGFHYLADVPVVNAFATDERIEIPDGPTIDPPAVVFMEGLAMVIRAAAAALAAHVRFHGGRIACPAGWSLDRPLRMIGRSILKQDGRFDVASSLEIFAETMEPVLETGDERFVSLARNYSAAMEMFVVAHEVGHIAYGHTLGEQANFEVSRNQERDADSFAASVLSSSPFREHLFLGQVFVTIIFAWLDKTGGRKQATSHPLGRERFFNALRSHEDAAREAAQQFGLSEEVLVALLPGDSATTEKGIPTKEQ